MMKNLIINNLVLKISNYQYNTPEKLLEIKYGLEGLYILITKTIFILIGAILLNILKESLIFLFLFNILRLTGFGAHANKSWSCYIYSAFFFLILPLICKYITLNNIFIIISGIVSIMLIFIFSPADTKKRPIVNKKRKLIYKYITTINSFLFIFISLIIKDNFIINALVFTVISETILILPITYKMFNKFS